MRKTIRRAISKTLSLEADCPIEATCVSRDDQTKRWVSCGWYGGVRYDQVGGATVTCTYQKGEHHEFS